MIGSVATGFLGRAKKHELVVQFVRFALIGALAASVDIGLHWLLVYGLRIHGVLLSDRFGLVLRRFFAELPPEWTPHELSLATFKVVSTMAGIAVSFVLNRKFTFDGSSSPWKKQLVRYSTVVGFGLVLNTAIVTGISLLFRGSQSGWLLGSLTATAIVAMWNFLGHRKFSFGDQSLASAESFEWNLGTVVSLICIVTAIATLLFSLTWGLSHDVPVVLYPAYLVWTGQKIPYSGVFDFNFPGTYFIYGLVAWITGMNTVLLHVVNAAVLVGSGTLMVLCFPKASRFYATGAFAACICSMLASDAWFCLQRENFCLLFAAGACLVCCRGRSSFWIGLLAGCSTLVKPTSIVAFIWVFIVRLGQVENGKDRWREIGFSALGFCLPATLAVLWLVKTGSLSSFLDIARHYTPLYGSMDGEHVVRTGPARLVYDVKHLILVTHYGLINSLAISILVGAGWLAKKLGNPEARSTERLFIGMTVAFYFYPVFTGQFWPYHFIPFWGFSSMLVGMGLASVKNWKESRSWISAVALGASCVSVLVFSRYGLRTFQHRDVPATQANAGLVASYLEKHLQPGDTVQPLDWTGGMVGGMMEARAPLATSFVYDFSFYHSVSTPYIQGLRRKFIGEFEAARPRFVLETWGGEKELPSGHDTTHEFPALNAILSSQYHVDYQTDQFRIWVRKDGKTLNKSAHRDSLAKKASA